MTDFLQLVIAGLATGAIYALAAIGFTLLWQTSQTINFAQGEFVMLPAFFALAGMKWLGLPFSRRGLARHHARDADAGPRSSRPIIVDPLIRQGVLPLVISTIALAIFLKDGVKDLYSAEAQPFPTILPDTVDLAPRRQDLAGAARRAGGGARHHRGAELVPRRRRAPDGRCRPPRRTRRSRASSASTSSA